MQQQFVPSEKHQLLISPVYFVVSGSIGTVSDFVLVHPEDKYPSMRSLSPATPAPFSIKIAADIDKVGDSSLVRPDIDRPTLPELWRENLLKRERKKPPQKKPENRRPEPDNRIDDYA